MADDDFTRDPLALAMLAAWLNVRVDQLPETMRAHTCRDTMERWKRVGEAALAYHAQPARLTPSIPGAN
jgi:hypothetical protein